MFSTADSHYLYKIKHSCYIVLLDLFLIFKDLKNFPQFQFGQSYDFYP